MRLVCPNCSARYEVDDSAIPATGRDVQCASCGETWFQTQPKAPPPRPARGTDPAIAEILREEAEREAGIRDRENGAGAREGEAPPAATRGAGPEPEPDTYGETAEPAAEPDLFEDDTAGGGDGRAEGVTEGGAGDGADDGTEDGAEPSLGVAARRGREALTGELRRRETETTTRPEATEGLRAAPQRPSPDSTAEMPDSELLDQSLRPAGETREAPVEEVEPRSRRGAHRFGFTLAVFLALILLIVYVLEPQIADAWPQGTPHLERYVALVNQARHVTAGLFASLVEVVRNLLAEYI